VLQRVIDLRVGSALNKRGGGRDVAGRGVLGPDWGGLDGNMDEGASTYHRHSERISDSATGSLLTLFRESTRDSEEEESYAYCRTRHRPEQAAGSFGYRRTVWKKCKTQRQRGACLHMLSRMAGCRDDRGKKTCRHARLCEGHEDSNGTSPALNGSMQRRLP
jgi:hypothetical protein